MTITGSTLKSLRRLGGKIKAVSIPQFFGELRKADRSLDDIADDGYRRTYVDVNDLGEAAYLATAEKGDSYSGVVTWHTDEAIFTVILANSAVDPADLGIQDFARSIADDLSAS